MELPEQRQDLTRSDKNGHHELLHGDIGGQIVGAYYTVKSELGLGFPERVYANAMSVALRQAGLSVTREVRYDVVFRGVVVGQFRADLVVEDKIIVETKVVRAIVPAHREQLWHQLRAANLPLGMLANYGDQPGIARVLATDRAV